jgi:acetyl esterase/lipase
MTSFHRLILAGLMLIGLGAGQRPAAGQTGSLKAEPKQRAAPKSEDSKKSQDKFPVKLTPRAAARIREVLTENDLKEKVYLRFSASDDSGFKMNFAERADPEQDIQGESLGIPILLDRKSSSLLSAWLDVDFVNEGGQTGFKLSLKAVELGPPDTSISLVEARRGFKATVVRQGSAKIPLDEPPAKLFRVVRYDAPPGKLAAYLTPDPGDRAKHPAIIWITGGDCNSIGDGCWEEGPPNNDQSAAAYRKAGIVMMFPSFRGGNDNPGTKEGFLGEVDDVLAAADFLRKQAYVDPNRVYLGGHSTGGTLALLTAECSDRFRAVFPFGPAEDVAGYGTQYNPFAMFDAKELQLRAPGLWLHSIRSPVFVFEGTGGNLESLQALAKASKNPKVRCFEIKGTNHFGVLAPTNRLIAEKILRDTGPACNLSFTAEELNKPFRK